MESKLQIEDRILNLSKASQQYLRGEIDYDQYKKLETKYSANYYAATIADNSIDKFAQRFIAKMSKLIRKLFNK